FTRGDAWTNQYYFGGHGDGTLFYPGTPAKIGGTTQIPIASLRLGMIREGQEDYEYFKALADAGDPAMADAEAEGLSPSAYNNMNDPAAIDAARHRMALRIEQLTGKTPPPMGDTTSGSATGDTGTGGNGATTGDSSAPATAASGGSGGGGGGGCAFGAATTPSLAELLLAIAATLLVARRRLARVRARARSRIS